jgi:hypothetical protein
VNDVIPENAYQFRGSKVRRQPVLGFDEPEF